MVSSLWHLLHTVDRLVEPAHQLRVSRINEVGGLSVVDRLSGVSWRKAFLTFVLVHGPSPRDDQRQHSLDGGGFHDGVEGLIVVHPGH
jgi:hypothetical protein